MVNRILALIYHVYYIVFAFVLFGVFKQQLLYVLIILVLKSLLAKIFEYNWLGCRTTWSVTYSRYITSFIFHGLTNCCVGSL